MLAEKDDIQRYIPQRDPMVMIHQLVEASDSHAVTQLRIEEGNIFVANNEFKEPGLIENIAQTAAAHVGYQCSMKDIPVPVGFIAAVRRLKIFELPKLDTVITTSIKITNQVFDVTVAEGRIEQGGRVCCSCEMRIFVKGQV
jgi:3-hydroxyacyl-[acyl-carrier-protein] dehydratase